jgi:6-phosphogluconolactonase
LTRLTTCSDAEAVAVRAAAEIKRHLQRLHPQVGAAHVALSGGTSPTRTYELLAREPADWADVEVWFADERCVGPEAPDSNYRLLAETLLAGGAIAPERVHRMEGELGPQEGALRYADALRAHIAPDRSAVPGHAAHSAGPEPPPDRDGLPVLDLIVLGIGPDGHIASLFPDAPTLAAGEQELCLGVWDSPKPPPQRITLSLPVLRAARRCLLLATGAGKRDAVAAMLAEPTHHTPASLLRRERLTVIMDDAASPEPAQR